MLVHLRTGSHRHFVSLSLSLNWGIIDIQYYTVLSYWVDLYISEPNCRKASHWVFSETLPKGQRWKPETASLECLRWSPQVFKVICSKAHGWYHKLQDVTKGKFWGFQRKASGFSCCHLCLIFPDASCPVITNTQKIERGKHRIRVSQDILMLFLVLSSHHHESGISMRFISFTCFCWACSSTQLHQKKTQNKSHLPL